MGGPVARLDREEQRKLDAYQAEAIELDELKKRREQIQIRKQILTMQRDQEQRLRCERQTAKEVWADLRAFCERVRSRLDEATLAERQRILQLLIDHVIVGEDALEIRPVIPLGRLKAEPADPGPPTRPGQEVERGTSRRGRHRAASVRSCVRTVWNSQIWCGTSGHNSLSTLG